MSIFDVLGNGGSLGSILDTFARQAGSAASDFAGQARSAATDFRKKAPGGMGGLLGAGALGALFGNLASSDMLKNATLLGAGAVAWNFYKKWANKQQQQQQQTEAQGQYQQQQPMPSHWPGQATEQKALMQLDPTAELVMRSMVYAAKADGHIDAMEQSRINKVLQTMMGSQDVSGVLRQIENEPIDPGKIAAASTSQDQADDIYRLSCSVIDIDQFMERNYLDALAKALHISDAEKTEIEAQASQARKQLVAELGA